VPVTFASYRDFASKFGNTDGEKFGPIAIAQWFANRQAGTYLRVLGAGDGKTRASDGSVTRAGFVVGSRLPQASGLLGDNVHANTGGVGEGRTFFLGCFMSESAGSTIFSEAGLTGNKAHSILRGVILAPSGVVPFLSSTLETDNAPNAAAGAAGIPNSAGGSDAGALIGTVNKVSQEFVLLLNGLKQTESEGKNIITASFDPQASNYFPNVLNTDPLLIESQGHLLYRHYDVYSSYAQITGSGYAGSLGAPVLGGNLEQAAFITTGSLAKNTQSAEVPNFEAFKDRFQHAFSPFVVSQKFGGSPTNLFKVHCLDAGLYPNKRFKVSVENIQKSNNPDVKFGKFDVVVREFGDDDRNLRVLEAFRGLSIDPNSERYVARVIGDLNTFYDFDQRPGSQKVVVEGKFPNSSNLIRVQMNSVVDDGEIDQEALPVGFRGLNHLVTSGTTAAGNVMLASTGSTVGAVVHVSASLFKGTPVEPPVPFRRNVAVGTGTAKRSDAQLYWGAQFEPLDSLTLPNKNNAPQIQRSPMDAYTNYFANYHVGSRNPSVGGNEGTANDGGVVLDADAFNNNIFSLERVQVVTSSTDVVDSKEWQAAVYRRDEALASSLTKNDGVTQPGRFLNIDKDFGDIASKQFFKFSFPVQGGFDGVNIFDDDKSNLLDVAIKREVADSNQGGINGPTVQSYRKAIDILEEKSDVDIQLLAIPGIRQSQVTDYAIDAVENRFDALYIMDIPVSDAENNEITGSAGLPNVTNTVTTFKGRPLDSSFAAAYFPDVVVTDPTTNTNVQVPPSVAVLGAFGLNDAVAFPWFAPAGFARGALAASEVAVKTNRSNLDALYDARINPITVFPGQGGPTIFGQKTLQAAESALDRVNVRRLLIEIRRQVRQVANTFIFEPNRETTLARFSGAVTPILNRIQQQQGVDRFRVQIDTTTTTQADVENNTVRGKIFLQPTRSVEFISLDFVVSNAGAEI
ncbi:MAG: hypothetical protein CMA72_06730, partial [Euryarchaeota archaeon]|nr:hypothetical protein [Euryarchaeota archaeon]